MLITRTTDPVVGHNSPIVKLAAFGSRQNWCACGVAAGGTVVSARIGFPWKPAAAGSDQLATYEETRGKDRRVLHVQTLYRLGGAATMADGSADAADTLAVLVARGKGEGKHVELQLYHTPHGRPALNEAWRLDHSKITAALIRGSKFVRVLLCGHTWVLVTDGILWTFHNEAAAICGPGNVVRGTKTASSVTYRPKGKSYIHATTAGTEVVLHTAAFAFGAGRNLDMMHYHLNANGHVDRHTSSGPGMRPDLHVLDTEPCPHGRWRLDLVAGHGTGRRRRSIDDTARGLCISTFATVSTGEGNRYAYFPGHHSAASRWELVMGEDRTIGREDRLQTVSCLVRKWWHGKEHEGGPVWLCHFYRLANSARSFGYWTADENFCHEVAQGGTAAAYDRWNRRYLIAHSDGTISHVPVDLGLADTLWENGHINLAAARAAPHAGDLPKAAHSELHGDRPLIFDE